MILWYFGLIGNNPLSFWLLITLVLYPLSQRIIEMAFTLLAPNNSFILPSISAFVGVSLITAAFTNSTLLKSQKSVCLFRCAFRYKFWRSSLLRRDCLQRRLSLPSFWRSDCSVRRRQRLQPLRLGLKFLFFFDLS